MQNNYLQLITGDRLSNTNETYVRPRKGGQSQNLIGLLVILSTFNLEKLIMICSGQENFITI